LPPGIQTVIRNFFKTENQTQMKINLDYITTFAANAKHAARNHETVSIGGGEFSQQELATVAAAMSAFEPMLKALAEIADMLEKHPEFERGNSTVHYCAHKAKSAIADLK
jgi:hypothetical protein